MQHKTATTQEPWTAPWPIGMCKPATAQKATACFTAHQAGSLGLLARSPANATLPWPVSWLTCPRKPQPAPQHGKLRKPRPVPQPTRPRNPWPAPQPTRPRKPRPAPVPQGPGSLKLLPGCSPTHKAQETSACSLTHKVQESVIFAWFTSPRMSRPAPCPTNAHKASHLPSLFFSSY